MEVNYSKLLSVMDKLTLEYFQRYVKYYNWKEEDLDDKTHEVFYEFKLAEGVVSDGELTFAIRYSMDGPRGGLGFPPVNKFINFSNLSCLVYLYDEGDHLDIRGISVKLSPDDLSETRLSLKEEAFTRIKEVIKNELLKCCSAE